MSEEKKNEVEKTEEKKSPETDAAETCKGDACDNAACKDGVCDGGTCEGGTCSDLCGSVCGKNMFVWLAVIVCLVGVIAYFQMHKKEQVGAERPVKEKIATEVKKNAMELIEGQLVAAGTKVEIGDVTEQSGLYKMKLTVEGEEIISYMSKDMTKFIPQLIDIDELKKSQEEAASKQAAAAEVQQKSDKPVVELFVMSHCPYGTQIEKGILPVLKALGANIDAKIKFVDYAMHEKKEVDEQLRQYCVQEKEPQKFHAYLDCFLMTTGSADDARKCLVTAQVNQTLMAQCVAQTDQQFKVTTLYNDKSSWEGGKFPQFNVYKEDNVKYGVEGSPTLVINGETIQTGRDSASLMKSICSAFNTQPTACQTEMPTETPSAGFGAGSASAAAANTDAGCGA